MLLKSLLVKIPLFFLGIAFSVAHAETLEFIVMSDLHVKPMKNQMIINPVGPSKNNDLDTVTYPELMNFFENAVSSNIKGARFILITGDLMGHARASANRAGYLKSGFSVLKNQVEKHLQIPVLFTFGNNDSVLSDYNSYTSAVGDAALKAGWADPFLSNGTLCESQSGTYPCLIEKKTDTGEGYYTAWLAPKLKLVDMNTVVFVDKPEVNHKGDAASLNWLAEKLKETKADENVVLAMHVGPSGSWKKSWRSQFNTIIAKHPGKVIGIFAGHTHMSNVSAFQITNKSTKQEWTIPIITTAGLCTFHGNAPSFNHVMLARNSESDPWVIKNYNTWSYQQPKKSDALFLKQYYAFNSTYCPGKSDLSVPQCLRNNMVSGKFSAGFVSAVKERMSAGNPNFTRADTSKVGSPVVIKLAAQ